MPTQTTETRINGRTFFVPSATVAERHVIVTGKWIRKAELFDEDLVEGEMVADPPSFIRGLKTSGLKADIFTFAQKPPALTPKYKLPMEWENWAAVPITTYDDWWESLPQESRKNVRRSAKRGLMVRQVPFDDELIRGIKAIYDETPVRQGQPFWHFGKDIETVRKENATYIERSIFLGAYVNEELIGFVKLISFDQNARYIQILAKNGHQDKRPMNALVAKSVEVCVERGFKYLIYSKFNFGNKVGSPLTEFKRRNGFQHIQFPRYFVPLTLKGHFVVKLKLHRGALGLLPPRWLAFFLKARAWYFEKRHLGRERATVRETVSNPALTP